MDNNSSFLQYYTACQSKEFSSSTAQQSFVNHSYTNALEGGVNGEAKAQVLVVTPPLYFLEVGA